MSPKRLLMAALVAVSTLTASCSRSEERTHGHHRTHLVPSCYSTYFVTPSLRGNAFAGTAVSPGISFGAASDLSECRTIWN